MIHGLISIKTVIDKLYRDLDITTEVNEANCAEWIAEALAKIGTYAQYQEIGDKLPLTDGKVKLPLNFYRLVDISYNNKPLSWATNTMITNYDCPDCKIPNCCTEYNFYINDSYIVTNITQSSTNEVEPEICIVYLGVPVDDEGYPMVPDDVYFMEACASYVTHKLDYQNWRKGQITDKVYEESKTNWLFYVNSARGSANMPNAAGLEKLLNVWVRLIPKENEYSTFFKNNSTKERKKRH